MGQQESHRALEMCHLYHASGGAAEDYDLISTVREAEAHFPNAGAETVAEGSVVRLPGMNRFCDTAPMPMTHDKDQGGWGEFARFEYYDKGENAQNWPQRVMEAELSAVRAEVAKLEE